MAALRRTPLFWGLLLLLLALPLPSRAQQGVDTSRREELERQIGDYQQLLETRKEKLAGLERELEDTSAELKARVVERDRVSAELTALQRQRDALQTDIAGLQEQLAETNARIDVTLAKIDSLKTRIRALLVNLYQQRSGRYARVLAEAESFHELQVKNHYLTLLSRQDVELVNELEDARNELLDAQAQLSQQLTELNAKEEELARTETELSGKRSQLVAIITDLESTRAGQLAQQQQLLQAQDELESRLGNLGRELNAEIERLEAEEERLRQEAAKAFLAERERQRLLQQADAARSRIDNLTATPAAPRNPNFIFPVARHEVISRYGGGNSFIALRADTANAAVRSVQDGVVRTVSLVSANDGYLVAVQHSGDVMTVYTNLRPPTVKLGDRVAQGDVIGYLGGGTLVPSDILKLWVQVTRNGRTSFVDPASLLGF